MPSTMHDTTLSETYVRYKGAEKELVAWLVKTVRQRGNIVQVLGRQDLDILPPRNDKTARKGDPKLTLEDKDWKQLASAIYSAQVSSQPPPTGLNVAISLSRDAIRLRRECRVWYNGGDDGHDDFIEVLKAVLDILVKTQNNSKQDEKLKTKKSAARPVDKQTSGTPYATLTLEEPPKSLQTPLSPIPTDDKLVRDRLSEKCKVEVDHSGTGDKILSAMHTFHECYSIRKLLCDVWQQYVKCETSLPTASQMTLAACLLIQVKAEELRFQYPDLDDLSNMLEILGVTSSDDGRLQVKMDVNEIQGAASMDANEVHDVLCLATLPELYKVQRLAQEDAGVTISEAIELPETALAGLVLLREFLAKSAKHASTEPIHGFEPITLAFLQTWDCFGIEELILLQVYSDIDVIVRSHCAYSNILIERTLSELRFSHEKSALQLEKAVALESERMLNYSTFRDKLDSSLDSMSASTLLSDDDHDGDPHMPLKAPLKVKYAQKAYAFTEMHPLYAGMLLSRALHVKHQEDILQASSTDILVAMAHLYNAARVAGYWEERWIDMDFLVEDQGMKSLGLLELPKVYPAFAAAKAWGKVMGVDYGAYNKNLSHKRYCADYRVPLPPEMASARKSTSKTNMTGGSLFFNALKRAEEDGETLGLSRHKASHITLHDLAKKVLDDPSHPMSTDERRVLREQRDLSPVQLLKLLEWALITSDNRLVFDYFGLITTCAEHLAAMKTAYGGEIEALRARRGLPKEFKFRDMVDEVLWEAVCEEYDGKLSASDRGSLLRKIGVDFGQTLAGEKSRIYFDAALTMTRATRQTTLETGLTSPTAPMDIYLTSTLPRVIVGREEHNGSAIAWTGCTDLGPVRDELRSLIPPKGMLAEDLLKRFPRFNSTHPRELGVLMGACTLMESSGEDCLIKPKFSAPKMSWRRHYYPDQDELEAFFRIVVSAYKEKSDHTETRSLPLPQDLLKVEVKRAVDYTITPDGRITHNDAHFVAHIIGMVIDPSQHELAIEYAVKLMCHWSMKCRPVAAENTGTPVTAAGDLAPGRTPDLETTSQPQDPEPRHDVDSIVTGQNPSQQEADEAPEATSPASAEDTSAAATGTETAESDQKIQAATTTNTNAKALPASDNSVPTYADAATQTEPEQVSNAWVDTVHRRAQLLLSYQTATLQQRVAARELYVHEMQIGMIPPGDINLRKESDLARRKVVEAEAMFEMASEARDRWQEMDRQKRSERERSGRSVVNGGESNDRDSDDREDEEDDGSVEEEAEAVNGPTGGAWPWIFGCIMA